MRKALLVVVVIAIIALLGYRLSKSGAEDSASPMNLVPASVGVAGSVDMTKLQTVNILEESLAELQAEMEKDESYGPYKDAGFTLKNIKRGYFGVDISKALTGGTPDFIIIIEMVDKLNNFEAALQKDPDVDRTEEVAGSTIYIRKDEEDPEQETCMIPFSDSIVGMGTLEMARNAARLAAGEGEAVKENAKLTEVRGKGDEGGLLWCAVCLSAEDIEKLSAMAGPEAPVQADAVKEAFVSIDYAEGTGLTVNVISTCESEEAASQTKAQLEQLKGLALMLGLQDDAISIEQKGSDLVISVTLSDAFLEQMKADMAAEEEGAGMEMEPEMDAMPETIIIE